MNFAQPVYLNLLWLLVPLFFFLRWAWKRKRKALQQFGQIEILERLMGHVSTQKQKAKLVLLFLVFAFSILALARPLWGRKETALFSKGRDILILLDVSRSMLAEDVKPNRLAKAKHEIQTLIDTMKGNRIGLVIFAGEAFVQCPLTLDYSAAKLLLNEIHIGSIEKSGTAIGTAIDKALDSFPPGERESRVIILITDGEDTVSDPGKAAERAEKEGVMIYAIGIGDPVGVPIPLRDESGTISGYVEDDQGNVVTSKLGEETLRNLSFKTGGAFHLARADELELTEIYEHMEQRRQKQLLKTQFISLFEERYQYFLFPALLCLVVEMLMSDRKRSVARTVGGYVKNGEAVKR
ncbi:MAG: VWA domain-containing protein [bacterium]|jgi:Ca-activated chloride channel family protein|nr:VWA domain-containing protein [bacterium]